MNFLRRVLFVVAFLLTYLCYLATEPARVAEKKRLEEIEILGRQAEFERYCQEFFETVRQVDRDCAIAGFKPQQ